MLDYRFFASPQIRIRAFERTMVVPKLRHHNAFE